MTIIFSLDATGPNPMAHEAIQIGMLLVSDDLHDVRNTFASYIRPSDPTNADLLFLSQLGIRDREDLWKRGEFWETPEMIWRGIARAVVREDRADRGALGEAPKPGDLARAIERARLVCYAPHVEIPLFIRSLRLVGENVNLWTARHVTGVGPTAMDYARSYELIGRVAEKPPETFAETLAFYKVRIARATDAMERAEALRRCMLAHNNRLKTIYARAFQSAPGGGRKPSGPPAPRIWRKT